MAPSGTELTAWARSCQISRDPQQRIRSEKRLGPVRGELLRLAREHRRRADERLRGKLAERGYPVGCCRQIRDAVWESLSTEPLIRELASGGLVWKRVYFICDGAAFQNAIQLGDWIVDAAHDTVDRSDDAVVVAPLDSVGYENIDGWARFAEVCERYHRLRLYPNFYFPLIFPLSPFVAVGDSGRVEIPYFQNMIFLLDLGDQWRRARRLLADEAWMGRRLPESHERALEQLVGASPMPVEFRRGDRGDLEGMLAEWDQITALPPAERNRAVEFAQKVAVECTRRLRAGWPAPHSVG